MSFALSDFEGFEDWVRRMGGEVLAPTNEWEVIRFKDENAKVHVVYKNKHGAVTYDPIVYRLMKVFKKNGQVPLADKTKRLGNYKKQKLALLHRDGDECFYCGKPLEEDITAEHLIALDKGGPNKLENMVLAHKDCNEMADNLPIIQKVKLREKMRTTA